MKQNSEYYDNVYRTGGHKGNYFKDPEATPYWNLWEFIVSRWIIDKSVILDLGCGNGQFSRALHSIRPTTSAYFGLDFSPIAIKSAKENPKRPPPARYAYTVTDLEDVASGKFSIGYIVDTVISLETFEHLGDDLDLRLLEAIPKGTHVILSVPNFDADGHVRSFRNIHTVHDRYGKYIDISGRKLFRIGWRSKIFAICGTKL